MRAIAKGNEPACLTQHRAMPHSDFDNFQGKDALRVALVAEQRGLCCYCMTRIVADGQKMKIEHWQCQANYPQFQLAYANLLGACLGGHGAKPDDQTCDNRKANRDLKWNPARAADTIESRVKYRNNGEIRSDDQQFDDELESVLNLNIAFLKNNRKGALEAVQKWWQIKKPNRNQVQARLNRIDGGVDELNPFAPVAVWFLKRKLAA